MSSEMFKGKESLNRIELSRLVQELLNFGVFGFLRLLVVAGWMDGVEGGWRVPPTHVHMHVHARMHTYAHACMVNMVISCKWPPPLDLWKSQGFPMMSYVHACACMCMCVHVHVHMGGVHPLTTPNPLPPSPPSPRGDPGIIQNSIALELIEIFQFCLKI